jgi:Na+-transporting NADH:ubiquinone oxidoreductase subunit C
MSEKLKPIIFALGMCLVCGVLLTTAATALQRIQERNMVNDRRKNILQAVDLISHEKSYTPEEIAGLYQENITKMRVDGKGRIISPGMAGADQQTLPIYLYTSDGEVRAYVIPIESQGLWGKIHAYMAMKSDGRTVAGFTVYQHSETPGLGGEIEARWFEEKFEGKQIVDKAGDFVSVKVAKGEVEKRVPEDKEEHYVDGISGATITGNYLSQGLYRTLKQYEPVSISFRKNRLRCRLEEEEPWCEPDESLQN